MIMIIAMINSTINAPVLQYLFNGIIKMEQKDLHMNFVQNRKETITLHK